MISRRGFTVAALGASTLPLAAQVQPASSGYRIGWLAPAPVPSNLQAFRAGMRALGYAEGNNLVIVQRYAIEAEQQAGLTAELVAASVDVFMSSSLGSARAAKNTAGSTPVVFVAGNPVESGLVVSLARPGGKVTGLSLIVAGLDAKRLQLFKEFFPKVSRVGILMTPRHLLQLAVPGVEAAARSLGLEIVRLEVRGADDIEPALDTAAKDRVGALLPLSSPLFNAEKQRIVSLAAKHRLPAMYEHRDFTEAGGLLSYGPDIVEVFRRAAGYVDKIFKGANPADLPVEQPTKVELVINLKTAKALSLTIPQALLLRADEVIE
jgi:putative tryptophan/tyrosine transport system substrate-binding protein